MVETLQLTLPRLFLRGSAVRSRDFVNHAIEEPSTAASKVLRVGFDIDGPILDGAKQKLRILLQQTGIHVDPRHLKKHLIHKSGITLDQYEAMKMVAYRGREEALKFELIEEALIHLELMSQEHGWKLSGITSRPGDATNHVNELFGMLGCDRFIKAHTARVADDLSTDAVNKATVIEQLGGIDVYVDDEMAQLERLRGKVPHLFLFTQPYNLDEDPSGFATRVSGHRELYLRLCAIAQTHPCLVGSARAAA